MKAEANGRYTPSGIPIKDYYGPQDANGANRQVEVPGTFPFTRGRRAQAMAVGGWIQRELSGEGDGKRSNRQFHYLLDKGQTGLDVIGDSPTQAMMDPDHPLAANAIGTQGVSLCHKQDFLDLFRDIPLDRITVSLSVTTLPAMFALAGLNIAAKEYGFACDKLRGSTVLTPFYSEDVSYAIHLPFDARVRIACDVIEYCARTMPKFHSFVEDTYYFSESGLDPVEEMALGFLEIRHLVREVLKRGVDIDAFAPRIAILVNCGMDFFAEIAKIRATRRLFARMIREEFGAKDPRSWSVVITSHTSGHTMTAQQLTNNIVRGATQTMALVMAGAHAIEISAFDEALRTPCEESHLVALRTQQIIESETGVARVVDPLGGSYYVEALTDEMERRIWAMIQEIEASGEPQQLHDSGWFRAFFEEKMRRYHARLESKEQIVVGVNAYPLPPEEDTLLRDVSETKIRPYRERIDEVKKFKANRDLARTKAALTVVRDKTKMGENLTPALIDAIEASATMGEIAGTIRQAYGFPYDPHKAMQPLI
ncbi:MAG: acyl-CoA mutase large subunit family protein [Candidatus Binataceae bacterium]